MLKNAFKKHPLQNRTNVQIKGGGGQRPFEQCSKKLHFSLAMASLSPPSHFVRNPHLNWHDSPNPFHIVCLDHSEQSYYTSHALNAKFENQLQTEFIRGARLRVCQSGLKSNAVTQPMWGQECLVMLLAFTISLFTVICQLSLCGLKPSLDKHKDRKAHENLQ